MVQKDQMHVSAYIPLQRINLIYLSLSRSLAKNGIRRNRKMINMFVLGRKL
jgi:hypothetical protein